MRIKELREEHDLTQSEVATAIKTSQRNISRWENGENEPSSSFVIKLADFFMVSTDYLLSRSDDLGVPVVTSPPHLSADEKKLLSDWRGLAPELRQVIKDLIVTWQSSGSSVAQKKKA